MNKLLTFLLITPLFMACELQASSQTAPLLKQKEDGLYYLYDYVKTPFTGKLIQELATGNRLEGFVENGQYEGEFIEYYPNGQVKIKSNYLHNELIGIPIEYTENGERLIAFEHLEERDGVAYEIGQTQPFTGQMYKTINKNMLIYSDFVDTLKSADYGIIGFYKNGLRDGHWQWVYSNNNIEKEGDYQDGKEVGLWKWYDQAGNIVRAERKK